MADSKISALTALTGANVAGADDVIPIVDTSVTTSKKITVNELRIALLSNTVVTNTLSADVDLNDIASYFTGPTCAQGTSGTWFASGTVTLHDTAGNGVFDVKLWDGTTVIASAITGTAAAGFHTTVSLSGVLASPAGNIRMSVKDIASTSGFIRFNNSGNSKDSTLTVMRIG